MVRLSRCITRLENEVHQAMAVMDADTGKLLNYRQLMRSTKYSKSMESFISQQIQKISKWHRRQNKKSHQHYRVYIPTQSTNRTDERCHIGQFVCTEQPEKAEPNQTRFTVGGDKINYPGAVTTPTAEMLAAKMLFNSVISTKDARFMTMDISNFYLKTPLHRPK